MKVFAFTAYSMVQRADAKYWRLGRLSLRYPSLG